jgi:hypothetical protein
LPGQEQPTPLQEHADPKTDLRENEFAYHGMLLGREIAKVAPM